MIRNALLLTVNVENKNHENLHTFCINMELDIVIRKANMMDTKKILDVRIAAIRAQCNRFYEREVIEAWTDDLNGDILDQFMAWVESSFYVAMDDVAIVGCGAINLESGQIDGIFIHPNYMGREIGRRMMAHLEGLALSTELTEIFLDSTLNAAPFYRKCGFNGEAVSTYPSPRGFTIDCVRMTKSIDRNQC
jgi:N-acetylglutamate synthase-like GNAT family acetyltransferase